NEGQLLRKDEGWNGSSALRTTTYRYRQPAGQPYPEPVGVSPLETGDHLAARHRPQDLQVISQQGVNFSRETGLFNAFALPLTVTRSSTLGHSRSETTVYSDHLGKWVIGQLKSRTGPAGSGNESPVIESHVYDTTTANVLSSYAFERLLHTNNWLANGMLASRTDGAGRTTGYSDYHRGLARLISHPDGRTESAAVNNLGLITSHTNEVQLTTSYGYDAMGRLASVTPPAGFHPTTLSFVPVQSAAFGMPAGHWRQTISTGNARTERYFDGLWRERLTRSFDASDAAATPRVVERRFDADSRLVYQSYPLANLGSVDGALQGTSTGYDALGRVVSQTQTSELGLLTTQTDYLGNFERRITNPRGFASTQRFQAFDVPSEDAPAALFGPEQLNLAIVRDAYGKPRSVNRSGSYGG
ncbi:MAG: RHS repeat domain-containing protein, partial [Rubrivivax sp.]|nr:RHS repeat domain-containing protein [Rubrivivax sp.]